MNHQDKKRVILEWVQKYRPDLLTLFTQTLQIRESDEWEKSKYIGPDGDLLAPYTLMVIGFRIGRQFQKDNPDIELDSA